MATFTKDQKETYKQEQKDKQRELLAAALDRLTTSDGWREYLNSRAKFHKYSFSNTILIAMQRPDATDVAGAKKWVAAHKRNLLEGEKERPICIFAPIMTPMKDSAGNPVKDEKGKTRMRVVFYKIVRVYDVSQTEGDPLPEPVVYPLEGNSHEEALLRLKAMTSMQPDTDKPINAQVYDLCGAVVSSLYSDNYGWYTSSLDGQKATAQQSKVIIEAATYLACRQMGLDTSGVSLTHIAKWDVDDDKKRLNAVREFAQVIDTLSSDVLKGVRL